MGNYSGAIADYDRAIGLKPDFEFAICNRANAKLYHGDLEGCITDCDRAVAIDATDKIAYLNRAAAKQCKADYVGALADYDRYVAMFDGGVKFPYFNRVLLSRRLHQSRLTATLRREVAEWETGWPKNIGSFIAGLVTEKELLNLAQEGDKKKLLERQCEAYYYAGVCRLLDGEDSKARELFEKCIAAGPKNNIEHRLARAELTRMSEQR